MILLSILIWMSLSASFITSWIDGHLKVHRMLLLAVCANLIALRTCCVWFWRCGNMTRARSRILGSDTAPQSLESRSRQAKSTSSASAAMALFSNGSSHPLLHKATIKDTVNTCRHWPDSIWETAIVDSWQLHRTLHVLPFQIILVTFTAAYTSF